MDYDNLVTLGQAAAEAENSAYWQLGACAVEVQNLPGRTLVEFGKAIGKSGSQLSEYACVTRHYLTDNDDLQQRIDVLKSRLCYTLFRDAKKLGRIEKSVDFLEMAHDREWSVDKARAMLADIKDGKSVMETWTVWDSGDLENVSAQDVGTIINKYVRELRQQGHGVRVKVYGVGERVTA
jgi:hypothetical protein